MPCHDELNHDSHREPNLGGTEARQRGGRRGGHHCELLLPDWTESGLAVCSEQLRQQLNAQLREQLHAQLREQLHAQLHQWSRCMK